MRGLTSITSDKDPHADKAYCDPSAMFVCASSGLILLKHRPQGSGVRRRRRPGRQAGEVLFGRIYAFLATTLAHMAYCCVY